MYIFGINIPLVELLFIAFLITLGFLGYAIYQFITLRRILFVEKEEIARIERDLGIIERKTGKQYSQQAQSYVQRLMQQGYSPYTVRAAFKNRKWPLNVIDKIFTKLTSMFKKKYQY